MMLQNSILHKLIAESSHPPSNTPSYKFAINSTIIQHHTAVKPSGTATASTSTTGAAEADSAGGQPAAASSGDKQMPSGQSSVERRGMHSATGAYWNNERDGMWNYKYDRGVEKGMEVVISVIWIGI